MEKKTNFFDTKLFNIKCMRIYDYMDNTEIDNLIRHVENKKNILNYYPESKKYKYKQNFSSILCDYKFKDIIFLSKLSLTILSCGINMNIISYEITFIENKFTFLNLANFFNIKLDNKKKITNKYINTLLQLINEKLNSYLLTKIKELFISNNDFSKLPILTFSKKSKNDIMKMIFRLKNIGTSAYINFTSYNNTDIEFEGNDNFLFSKKYDEKLCRTQYDIITVEKNDCIFLDNFFFTYKSEGILYFFSNIELEKLDQFLLKINDKNSTYFLSKIYSQIERYNESKRILKTYENVDTNYIFTKKLSDVSKINLDFTIICSFLEFDGSLTNTIIKRANDLKSYFELQNKIFQLNKNEIIANKNLEATKKNLHFAKGTFIISIIALAVSISAFAVSIITIVYSN